MENHKKHYEKILAINSNKNNLELLSQFLSKEGYQVDGFSSVEGSVVDILNSSDYALALVDITGFDKRIWDFCEKLREKGIPFIVISPRQISTVQQQSVEHGAETVLIKPVVIAELLSLIEKVLKK